MDAVLLAGGKGTRLRPLTVGRPKPLVPVANRPIMEYSLRLLEKAGFDRVFIPVDYLGDQIVSYATSLDTALSIDFTFGNLPLGTAGAVVKLRDRLQKTFLVISGDLLVDADLADMMQFHNELGAAATIALTRVEDPVHYGIALLEGNRISQFAEKPDRSQIFSDVINAGIYVLEPEVLERIPPGLAYDFSMDLFPRLMKDSYVAGYLLGGYWNDVGRPSRYLQANGDALAGRFPLGNFVEDLRWMKGMNPVMGKRSRIGRVSISCPVLLGDNCLVGGGSVLRGFVVLGDNVSVGEDCLLDGVVVHDNSRIEASAKIVRSIIGRNCRIGRGVELDEGTVIGDNTTIGSECHIGANMKIWSGSSLGSGTVIVPD